MNYKTVLLGILLFSATFISGFAQKKNVLFLMADDFNYWTSKNGYYPQAKTPNIDALAEKGVFFREAHCSSPVCNPSRNSLMSGYRPSTSGIDNNADGFIRDIQGFENIITLNQYFKENEYYTYGVGKIWHPGKMSLTDRNVDPENWSHLNTQASGCNGGNEYAYDVQAKALYGWGANPNAMSTANCNDYSIATQVANLITNYSSSENKDQPFFIGCGFFRPHMPWKGPKQFWDLFDPTKLEKPIGYKVSDEPGNNVHHEIVNQNQWSNAIRAYLATCALADYNVGIVMDALENSDLKDNTIVVFMGDHGWHLGEKGHWGKFSLWDEANHTTLIIYDPSAKGNSKECTKVVSLQDIYPTLVDLCGLPPKTDIEGRSLAPILDDPEDKSWEHPVLMTYAGTNYIKTNRYRFIDDGNNSKLFNNATDPYEWNNLYTNSSYNTIIATLRDQVDSMLTIGSELKYKRLSSNPFIPKSITIPGVVQAENYDEGANSQTYYDTTMDNTGGVYRPDDYVDIDITDDSSGGYHIANIAPGEWLQYSFANIETGNYILTLRLKNSLGQNQSVTVYLNDKKVRETNLGTNKEWQNIELSGFNINSSSNQHIKIKFSGNGVLFNFMNWVRKELDTAIDITYDGSKPFVLKNIIENTHINLDLTSFDPTVKMNIYNMKGQILLEDYLYGEMTVNYPLPHNFPKGTYFIRIEDSNKIKTEKFIINN